MTYVGYSSVANQANTTDGFASGVNARNNPTATTFGASVGDGGVVDIYSNGTPIVYSFIEMESTGYVLQENGSKIQMEVG